MRTFDELKKDRTFLDSVIESYGDGSVADLIFEIFIIGEDEMYIEIEKNPEYDKKSKEELEEELDEMNWEITDEWLRNHIDLIPYFDDIKTDSDWNLMYEGEQWTSSERIEFMKVFTENKEMEKNKFIEMLYYENNEIFIFLSYLAEKNLKSEKGRIQGYSIGDDMNPKLEDNQFNDEYSETMVLRTYDYIITINYGCGAVGKWLMAFNFDINKQNPYKDFSERIQPLSIKNDHIYNNDPVSSEAIMNWLYNNQ
jgi:hypothetical protein